MKNPRDSPGGFTDFDDRRELIVCGSPPDLLSASLSCKRLLDAFLFTRLQVKGVFLDFLDDVFLLNFSLEAAESILDRLALLNSDIGHCVHTPNPLLIADAYYPAISVKESNQRWGGESLVSW
jgi:hypothetical protein